MSAFRKNGHEQSRPFLGNTDGHLVPPELMPTHNHLRYRVSARVFLNSIPAFIFLVSWKYFQYSWEYWEFPKRTNTLENNQLNENLILRGKNIYIYIVFFLDLLTLSLDANSLLYLNTLLLDNRDPSIQEPNPEQLPHICPSISPLWQICLIFKSYLSFKDQITALSSTKPSQPSSMD